MSGAEWVTLDDAYIVDWATDRAVLVKHQKTGVKTWIPRAHCDGGERLEITNRDIVVKKWFAEREGLDY